MLIIPDHLVPILIPQPVHLASMAARGYKPHSISDITSDPEGKSLGESEKIWREIASTEMRIALMDNLISNKVGFNDVEMFNLGIEYNMKCKTLEDDDKERDTTVIEAAMKRKRKDEVKYRRKLITRRNRLRGEMMKEMGKKSNKYRRTMKHLMNMAKMTKENLKQKYDNKIEHLKNKYKDDKEKRLDMVPEEMAEFRDIAVFNKERFEKMEVQVPEIVKFGEVELNEDEEAVMRMHPKMAVMARLEQGYMELNQEIG